MSPKPSEMFLSAKVPNVHRDFTVVVGKLFHIESNSWFCSISFIHLQPVKNRRLAGLVKSDHQHAELFLVFFAQHFFCR